MDPDTWEKLSLFFTYGWPILLLMTAYFIGTMIEKRHFRSIRHREDEYREILGRYRAWLTGDPSLDPDWRRIFDENESLLATVELGPCEAIDY